MAHLVLLHVREELAFLLVVAALAVLVAVAATLALLQRRLSLPALLLLLRSQPCAPPGLNGYSCRSRKLAHTLGQDPLYFRHTKCFSSVVNHTHPVITPSFKVSPAPIESCIPGQTCAAQAQYWTPPH